MPANSASSRNEVLQPARHDPSSIRSYDIGDEHFRLLFEHLPWPAYVWQRSGDDLELIAHNRSAKQLDYTGIEQISGIKASELYPPDSIYLRDLRSCLDEFKVVNWEGDFEFVSGITRRMGVVYVPLSKDLLVVHAEDLSERRAAEAALRESEARTRALFASNPDVIFHSTTDGVILDVSDREIPFFPYAVEKIVGRSVAELYGEAAMKEHIRLSRLAVETGETQTTEYAAPSPDQDRYFELRFAGINASEVLVNARDITETAMLGRELTRVEERERSRIGRDLHDGLAQMLVAVKLINERMYQRLLERAPELQEDAAKATGLLRETIDQTRQIAQGFSAVAEGDSLYDVLRELGKRTEDVFGIACHVTVDAKRRIYGQAATAHLYRIAQEGITNAVRHGQASVVELGSTTSGTEFRLSVADNGRGLVPGYAHGEGYGLRIMRYRARMIGGQIELGPRNGGGVLLVCRCAQGIIDD